jgi:hypothetical protein
VHGLDPSLLVLVRGVCCEHLEEVLARLDAEDGDNVSLGLNLEFA